MHENALGKASSSSTDDGKRVTLIQCTGSKRDEMAPARDLYDESGYFRDMRAWAEARGNPWYILSAKHCLLHPATVIEPYDERGLIHRQQVHIAEALNDMGVTYVDVTAGLDYTNHLVPVLEGHGIDVINHFAGKQIGERRHLLQKNTPE